MQRLIKDPKRTRRRKRFIAINQIKKSELKAWEKCTNQVKPLLDRLICNTLLILLTFLKKIESICKGWSTYGHFVESLLVNARFISTCWSSKDCQLVP